MLVAITLLGAESAGAATVALAPAGGALEIAGTDASETLVVTQASGTYTVAGDAPVAPFGALGACVQGSGPNEVVCTPTGPVEVLSVNLADGDDSLTVARVGQTGALPTSVEQLIAGGAGDDTLRAGDGAVTFLESGAPPDCCPGALGEDGSDLLEAGVGPGEVDYSPREAPVTVVLPSGDTTSSGNGEAGENDRLTRVRSVVGGLVGDVLVGGEGADSVTGGPGADTLVGGGGADVFVQDQLRFPTVLRPTGPDGADELHGGGGADTVDYGRRDARVTVVLPDEGATTTGNGGNLEGDQLTGIENVVTGDGDDIVTGSAEPNRIAVGLGVNSVAAGGGNDHLDAGAEAATDLLDGGDGADTVDYGTRANGVTVSLPEGAAESTGNGEPGEADRLRAVEHVIGGAGPDVLTGSSAPNSVDAGPGDDELWLEAGDTDELACGPGFDLAVLDAIDPPSLDCERTVLPPLAPLDLARPPSGDAGLGAGLSQPSVPSSRGIVTPLPAAAGDLRLARTQRHPRVRGRLQVNADAARVEVRLTARLPSRPARGRARRSVRRSVVGRSVQHVAGPVRLFFRATLTGRARAALSGRRSTPVRVRIVVTPTSGRSVSFSRTVVLKGAR